MKWTKTFNNVMLHVAVSAGKAIRREGTAEACALDKVTVKPVFEFIK